MNDTIKAINLKVREFINLEFTILSYGKSTLTIAGSQNLSYYHDFEITFIDVVTTICNNDWRIDTSKTFISILDGTEEAKELNLKYRVEIGNTIFKFVSDDNVLFYIIAGGIKLKNEVVKYS